MAEGGGTRHGDHIAGHLTRLGKPMAPKAEALLERAGLRRVNGAIVTEAGGPPQAADCERYLAAVQELLGETVYSFCRVNFALLGCSAIRPRGGGP
jgi:hypothetical protein